MVISEQFLFFISLILEMKISTSLDGNNPFITLEIFFLLFSEKSLINLFSSFSKDKAGLKSIFNETLDKSNLFIIAEQERTNGPEIPK